VPLIATLRGDAQTRLIAFYCRLHRSPAGRRTSDQRVLLDPVRGVAFVDPACNNRDAVLSSTLDATVPAMAIHYEDVNENIRRIFLRGRLDTAGSEQIATEFAELAASAQRRVVVCLSDVTFLSSMGIRALIASAKAQQARGGRMVLHVADNEVVARTLEATGIDALIPTFEDADDAERALLD
jgi:anti-anti-sigma factor